MKSYNKRLGFTVVLIAFLGYAINAQVADFEYFSPCDDTRTLFVSTSTYPQGIDSYQWDFGDGSPVLTNTYDTIGHEFSIDGVYYVTLNVIRNGSVIDSKSKNVTIHPKPDVSFIPSNGCVGQLTEFKNTSNIPDVYEWDWNFGDNQYGGTEDAAHAYSDTGLFVVSLTVETVHGCTNSASHTIKVYKGIEPEIITPDNRTDFCIGEAIEFSVNNGPYNIQWGLPNLGSDESKKPVIVYNNFMVGDNIVAVTFYNTYQGNYPYVCPVDDQITITIHDLPVLSLSSSESLVVPGGEVTLSVTSNTTLDEVWWTPIYGMNDPANMNPVVALDETTTFTVDAIDEWGCKNSSTILVEVELKPHNVLTPNGDGANDTWIASKNSLDEVVIYNRWGEMVYEAENYDNDWDGSTSDGDELPEGAYYYVIVHNDVTYTGSITLLR